MSLINQMLKELEQQRSGKAPGRALPKEVHAVEDSAKPRLVRLVVVILGVAMVAGGIYFLGSRWTRSPHPVAPPLPVSQPTPQPAATSSLSVHPAPSKPVVALQPAETLGMEATQPAPEASHRPETPKKAATKSGGRGKLFKQVSPAEQSEYHYQRAAGLLQQGRVSEAEADLRAALVLEPHNIAARQVWVGLLLEQKRYGEAEKALQQGLGLDPGQLNFSTTLARLQVESGDNRSALDTLKRALPYAGESADFYGFLAALLQRAGQNGEAANYFGLALKKVPSVGKWWIGMGISLKEENKMREAEAAFKHALSIQNLSPELRAYADQQIREISRANKP